VFIREEVWEAGAFVGLLYGYLGRWIFLVFSLRIDTPAFAAIHGNRRTITHIPLRAVLFPIHLEFLFSLSRSADCVHALEPSTTNSKVQWTNVLELVLLPRCRLDRTDTILAAISITLVQRREPSISCILAGNHIRSQGHGSDLVVRTKSITCADHNLS